MLPADRSLPAIGRSQSAAAVLAFGLVLAAILAASLVYVVADDYRNRLAAAEQQNLALTAGAERLAWLELRNLERAMRGIASDAQLAAATAPEHALALMNESIAGVAQRQRELESIVLIDRNGQPLAGGRGDPTLPRWPDMLKPQPPDAMRIGPLQQHGGRWLLPLAVPMTDGRWVLAWLHSHELQSVIADLDGSHTRLIQLGQEDGRLIADSRGVGFIGRVDHVHPVDEHLPRANTPRVSDQHDHVVRIAATGVVPDFPLHVHVGIPRATVLAPWWRLATAAVALYALYLLGLAYLVRVLRRNAKRNRMLVQRLTEALEGLRNAQELGRTGTWTAQKDGHIVWSGPVSQVMGLDASQTSASAREFYELMHPDDRDRVAAQFAEAWRGGEPFSIDYRVLGTDGRVRWLSARGARSQQEDGPASMAGTVLDITDRMESQQRLAEAERQFRLLFERNPLPFWVFDVETLAFLEVNDAAVATYGFTREEFLRMSILDIRPAEYTREVLQDLEEHRRVAFEDVRVWVHRRKDGRLLEARVHATDIEFRGRRCRLVLSEDVTELMAQQRELAYRASHDMTSGLLNADALASRVESLRKCDGRIAAIQLRGLELIEDSLGRDAGHETLRAVAMRVARLGERFGAAGHVRDDEFVLAVFPAEDWNAAVTQLQQELARPIPGEDTLHRLESWIGVTDLRMGAGSAAQAVAHAGLAAHVARTERRPLVEFEPSMARHATDRLKLAGRIHRAMDAHEFELHFQILWDVAHSRPAGLETLIRWPQREGGFVAPSQFIGLCEDTGLIVPLGRWALREAAAAQRLLAQAGYPDLPVAVNVSPAQFLDGQIQRDIETVLEEYDLPRGTLHIELTESVLMTRPEQALETLRGLQRHGVCISLDDFGTGFSSMSYLKQLPLDAIKIDQSFVRDVHRDERSASICQSLLALGHGLGLKVAGEGVETQAQYEWLQRHGCDRVQGYGIHRPEPLAQAIEQLHRMREWADGPWRASGLG
ncbi:bifunctional diguanylate cyclase/phosphodiesterase [Lysobacter sp.]|uniref:bifunctional diguanylate cyclase/phosphodiesterase n=1 Tax=Lysobacter sp. TaxID=72226 RepID=UPI002D4430DD|nr:EAL domain-containing protein [Lysobacter sp.]HZX76229.1 EAL domain-containing protein [Lysobacter sp.]